MQLRIAPVVFLVFAPALGFAQKTKPAPEFTSVSIRPASGQPLVLPDGRRISGMFQGGPGTPDPVHLAGNSMILANLVVLAYYERLQKFSGPEWTKTTRYDITAKVPAGVTKEEYKLMLQAMLAKSFNLRVHHETQEFPAYNLVVAEGGLKLKGSLPIDNCAPGTRMANGICPDGPIPISGIAKGSADGPTGMSMDLKNGLTLATGRRVTMPKFAANLELQLGSVVNDKTGLTDAYNYRLRFVAPTSQAALTATPSLFTAIEEFGLKLEPTTAPLQVLVIDQIEPPSFTKK
jgi:uncharacterized protein (TIGR03435 family)